MNRFVRMADEPGRQRGFNYDAAGNRSVSRHDYTPYGLEYDAFGNMAAEYATSTAIPGLSAGFTPFAHRARVPRFQSACDA